MRIRQITLVSAFAVVLGSIVFAQTAREILDRPDGTLYEAAKANGGTLIQSEFIEHGFVDLDLKDLARESDAVIVGLAVSNRCRLTSDQKSIETVYRIRVEDKLKGPLHQGEEASVALPGGQVSFPDGVLARINMPDFPLIANGRRFVMFLSRRIINDGSREQKTDENSAPVFVVTGGVRGLFELLPEGKVVPRGRLGIHIVGKYRNLGHKDFAEKVQDATEKVAK